ncbi:hypothetical protein, partial [Burkholderia gladioli]|uniref:hypothetical protein n=1 Tax=Burkholderia gladioli TaxID=28095 RepID=UPI001ABB2D7D
MKKSAHSLARGMSYCIRSSVVDFLNITQELPLAFEASLVRLGSGSVSRSKAASYDRLLSTRNGHCTDSIAVIHPATLACCELIKHEASGMVVPRRFSNAYQAVEIPIDRTRAFPANGMNPLNGFAMCVP